MKIKFSRELKIGLLVVATIAILYFGINYLKGINIFNPTNYYYVKYDDINGLVVSNPVTTRGHKVGQVKTINYNYDDPTAAVVVVLQLDDELKIPTGSFALLKSDLLGGPSIVLDLKPNSSKIIYKKGDTIPSKTDIGFMDKIEKGIVPKIDSIIPQLDTLIFSLQVIARNKSIEKSLENIEQITTNLKSTSGSLDKMFKNEVPSILAKVDGITTDFKKVGENLSQIDFYATMRQVDHTVSNLNLLSDKMNSKDGTIGLLLNDPALYNNLTKASGSANELLLDLKANPKRYVHFSLFGKK